jgi:hypothetical protein
MTPPGLWSAFTGLGLELDWPLSRRSLSLLFHVRLKILNVSKKVTLVYVVLYLFSKSYLEFI